MNGSTPFRPSRLALAVGAALSAGTMALPVHADTFTVTITQDIVDAGDGEMSYREAVAAAESNAGPDTIEFAASLDGQTLVLDPDTNGGIDVSDDLVIAGPGSSDLTITLADGTSNCCNDILFNQGGGDVSVSGLTVDGNKDNVTGSSRGIFTSPGASGGTPGAALTLDDVVVQNVASTGVGFDDESGTLTISNSAIRDNASSFRTAGLEIRDAAQADIVDSEISGNVSDDEIGSGIRIDRTVGPVTISGSTIADNTAGNGGAGIYFEPNGFGDPSTLRISDSTISGNTTSNNAFGSSQLIGSGAGLLVDNAPDLDYTLEIRQSTFSGNTSAAVGGAIYIGDRTASADIDIDFSTITDNTAEYSGGLLVANTGGADINVAHTVIAGNTGNQDARDAGDSVGTTLTVGDTINASYSFFGAVDANVVGDAASTLNGGSPGLAPLAIAPYGNQKTRVHIPGETSPLVDAGDPARVAGTGGTPSDDQTGIARIVDAVIDIGSVEFNPDPIPDTDDGDGGVDDLLGDGGGGGGGAAGSGLLGLLAAFGAWRRRR